VIYAFSIGSVLNLNRHIFSSYPGIPPPRLLLPTPAPGAPVYPSLATPVYSSFFSSYSCIPPFLLLLRYACYIPELDPIPLLNISYFTV